MRYQTEYILYASCYVAAPCNEEADFDDLHELEKKHLGSYATMLGFCHGKRCEDPLTPAEFDARMAAHDGSMANPQAPAHAPGDAADRPE